MMLQKTTINQLCQGLSYILHPFIIPTYAVCVLLFGESVLTSIPVSLKLFFVAVVCMNTLVIPALIIGLLHHFRVIPTLNMENRRERLIPMAVVAICYIVCAYMLSDLLMAFIMSRFLFAAMGCLLVASAVTAVWKISLHMTAIGGLVASLIVLNFSGFGQTPYLTMLFILLAGALGSARLQLERHNIAQVGAGFAAGFSVATLAILFL